MLIRFYIDASEWVPHPYAPPHWATRNYSAFRQYVSPNEEAFQLCTHWDQENSLHLTQQLTSRLRDYPIQIAARYRCYDSTDYADVAFVLADGGETVLHVRAPWKGQAALIQLVAQLYSDAICEYGAPWLGGQRIDIFIPSPRVALEYHGQQHYHAVEYFGGKQGLRATQARDRRKAEACAKAGVVLIEWHHSESITEGLLRSKLGAAGVDTPER